MNSSKINLYSDVKLATAVAVEVGVTFEVVAAVAVEVVAVVAFFSILNVVFKTHALFAYWL